MTKEDYVKMLILNSGHNVKSFAASIELPYTTLLGMLNRGLDGAGVQNVIRVCKGLSITVEDLQRVEDKKYSPIPFYANLLKLETKKFPMLGTITAGEPIYTDEQFESYVVAGANIQADFCLRIQGDSMINARIHDGDIVFIRKQPDVNDGEIAAILIGDEATLKRVYKAENELVLVAENPAYKPMIFKNEELDGIRILGKAIAFQSNIK